jgi:hypothetical protein
MKNSTSPKMLALGVIISFLSISRPAASDPAELLVSRIASGNSVFSPPSFAEIDRSASQASARKSGVQRQLKMVIIKTRSANELKQLRLMRLDIVRVRPDPAIQPGRQSLPGVFIVEAVVSEGMLKKLKAMGFEVYEAAGQGAQP